MPSTDPRVDTYIAGAPEFAQPILEHLRALVHRHCPEATETIKWKFPHFEYRGVLCSMAAFKQHCAFGFWHPLLRGEGSDEAMGQFGRIASLKDLPPDREIAALIRKAMELNHEGVKAPPKPKAAKPEIPVPPALAAALKKAPAARATFEAFAPSHRREYLEWITEAKTEATRDKRIAQALEWLAEGKKRNWKYEKC